MAQTEEQSVVIPPLDEKNYDLKDEAVAFFKSQTGIEEDEALKQHILAVQAKAYAV